MEYVILNVICTFSVCACGRPCMGPRDSKEKSPGILSSYLCTFSVKRAPQ